MERSYRPKDIGGNVFLTEYTTFACLSLLCQFAKAGTTGSAPLLRTTCNGVLGLCDIPIRDVVFPGTHNSAAVAGQRYSCWGCPVLPQDNQQASIIKQLQDGVRMIDLDMDLHGNTLSFTHGPLVYGPPMADTLNMIASWLEDNRQEVLVMSLSNIGSEGPRRKAVQEGFFRLLNDSALRQFIYTGPQLTGQEVLGAFVASGRRVIVSLSADWQDFEQYALGEQVLFPVEHDSRYLEGYWGLDGRLPDYRRLMNGLITTSSWLPTKPLRILQFTSKNPTRSIATRANQWSYLLHSVMLSGQKGPADTHPFALGINALQVDFHNIPSTGGQPDVIVATALINQGVSASRHHVPLDEGQSPLRGCIWLHCLGEAADLKCIGSAPSPSYVLGQGPPCQQANVTLLVPPTPGMMVEFFRGDEVVLQLRAAAHLQTVNLAEWIGPGTPVSVNITMT